MRLQRWQRLGRKFPQRWIVAPRRFLLKFRDVFLVILHHLVRVGLIEFRAR